MQAGVQHKVLVDALLPNFGTTTKVKRLAIDTALVIGGAVLVAICAQIAIKIPTTTVPITGQTFGVLLTGGALGSKRGSLSMIVYMLLGMVSAPIFAPKSSLMSEKTLHMIFPWSGTSAPIWDLSSGGYIVGFILAAFLVGTLSERGWDRKSTIPIAMLAGSLMIYLVGLPWLGYFIASDANIYNYIPGSDVLDKTLRGGLYPFIGGDCLKLLLAAMSLPAAWGIINRLNRRGSK